MATAENAIDIDEQKSPVKKTSDVIKKEETNSVVTKNLSNDCNGVDEAMESQNQDNSLVNGNAHSQCEKEQDAELDKIEAKCTQDMNDSDKKMDDSISVEKPTEESVEKITEDLVKKSNENMVESSSKDLVKTGEESNENLSTDSVEDLTKDSGENLSKDSVEDLGKESSSEDLVEKSGKDLVDNSKDSDKSNTDFVIKEITARPKCSDKSSDLENKNGQSSKSHGLNDADNSDCVEVIEDDEPVVIEEKGKEISTDENDLSKNGNISKTSVKIIKDDINNDDIEIVGESKAITINGHGSKSNSLLIIPQNVPSPMSALSKGFPNSTLLARNLQQSGHRLPNILGGNISSLTPNFVINSSSPSNLAMPLSNAPPNPKSSLDQIELIRWEIANRVNTRPKYFKPNPTSELGPLSKFLFDMGSDMIKESVYHELVKIQSRKNDDNKLTDKEKTDLGKLKEIEKDLHATIGHLKIKMKKKCKTCQFQTESINVMYLHKQFPHEEDKVLSCAHCKFTTKQSSAFKFHAEAEHNVVPKLHDKKAFYECNMCSYENNQEQKVNIHKQRCLKQFRPHFNLHPSCLSGAEINLCLENIFYKPIIPKGLKILQQKHAQQQAALAEARRQQAQIQALAAQKNKPNIKNQPIVRMPQAIAPRQPHKLAALPRIPIQIRAQMQNKVRLPEKGKNGRPATVANMLNNRQNIPAKGPPPPAPAVKAPGGFEVCEICGGYVKDRKALRIHFFYAHRIDLPFNLFERQLAPLYCATCYVRFWTAQGLRKHIDTHKEENATTGVVGKCISCGHQVLNLLIHMRIVHNREIQHYINALMCMFCGMHFGSRSDVDAHIKKIHGIIDPVTGSIKNATLKSNQQKNAQSQKNLQKNAQVQKSAKKSGGQPVKGSVCVLCNLNFGRNVDLTRHCMRMHHTCMKCGMVVIDKASLIKHTCLSSPSGTRDCSMCKETGFHPAYFVKHLRDKHLKKFSIQVARLSKEKIEKYTKRPYNQDEKVLVEISDSSEDESVNNEPTKQKVPPNKRPRMGPASMMKKYESPNDVVQIDDDEQCKNNTIIESEDLKKTDQSEMPIDDIKSEVANKKTDNDDIKKVCDVEKKTIELSRKDSDEVEDKDVDIEQSNSDPKPGEKRKMGPLSFQNKRKRSESLE